MFSEDYIYPPAQHLLLLPPSPTSSSLSFVGWSAGYPGAGPDCHSQYGTVAGGGCCLEEEVNSHCGPIALMLHLLPLPHRYQLVALDYSETMLFAWLDAGRPRVAGAMK